MKSTLSRVNGRSHRTISQKAKCECCKVTYIKWDFIGLNGKCYKCNGVGDDDASVIKFIAENK